MIKCMVDEEHDTSAAVVVVEDYDREWVDKRVFGQI